MVSPTMSLQGPSLKETIKAQEQVQASEGIILCYFFLLSHYNSDREGGLSCVDLVWPNLGGLGSLPRVRSRGKNLY